MNINHRLITSSHDNLVSLKHFHRMNSFCMQSMTFMPLPLPTSQNGTPPQMLLGSRTEGGITFSCSMAASFGSGNSWRFWDCSLRCERVWERTQLQWGIMSSKAAMYPKGTDFYWLEISCNSSRFSGFSWRLGILDIEFPTSPRSLWEMAADLPGVGGKPRWCHQFPECTGSDVIMLWYHGKCSGIWAKVLWQKWFSP